MLEVMPSWARMGVDGSHKVRQRPAATAAARHAAEVGERKEGRGGVERPHDRVVVEMVGLGFWVVDQ